MNNVTLRCFEDRLCWKNTRRILAQVMRALRRNVGILHVMATGNLLLDSLQKSVLHLVRLAMSATDGVDDVVCCNVPLREQARKMVLRGAIRVSR